MISLVLFDLDGTLIQSTEVIMETFKVTFDKYFKDVKLDDETLTSFLGSTLFKTFELYMDETHDINDIVSFYRETSEEMMKSHIKAYPNARESLEAILESNVQVGIVTSKMREVAREHLALAGLDGLVTHIVGYEDVKLHKPDKEPLMKALEVFGVDVSNAIYIGDHENDILAAKHAGMMSCAVTYSHRLKQMLACQPDYVIDDLLHVLDII
jgi:HAD superfamily hydrolase (TIGR01549 family)